MYNLYLLDVPRQRKYARTTDYNLTSQHQLRHERQNTRPISDDDWERLDRWEIDSLPEKTPQVLQVINTPTVPISSRQVSQ